MLHARIHDVPGAKEPFIHTDHDLRDERVLLIDAPLFGGNSGGPIFTYPRDGPMRLAGLISATNKSLAYAVAEPVSRIRETIGAVRATTPASSASWHVLTSKRN